MSTATERDLVRENDASESGVPSHTGFGGGPPHPAANRTAPRPARSIASRFRAALAILHRIIGAPDYDGYVAHASRCHPDQPPLTRDEFVRQRLEDRYSRPGSRCC
jgi:uncharacterized short protein YbdD (DUF466 family)